MYEQRLDRASVERARLNQNENVNISISERELPTVGSSFYNSFYTAKDEEFVQTTRSYTLAGRVRFVRLMGKAAFVKIDPLNADMSETFGSDGNSQKSHFFQIFFSKAEVGEECFNNIVKTLRLGDFILSSGPLFRTMAGEVTLKAERVKFLNRTIRSIPKGEEWNGDEQVASRMPYLNMAMNHSAREAIISRSRIIREIRNFMDSNGFIEVETPILHPIAGGASAKPFVTHHNHLDLDMYLRIAPELYLKKLLVGGFQKVFEIGRNFRNEGVSSRHNPEFTAIEFYQACATYEDHMNLVESLIFSCADKKDFVWFGHEIELSETFERTTVNQEVQKFLQVGASSLEDRDFLIKTLGELNIKVPIDTSLGSLVYAIFEEKCEELLIQPTFVTRYPSSVSPLARRCDDNPDFVDRFELFIAGKEIANGFNELNDPEDQYNRFMLQVTEAEKGNEEAMSVVDYDYIKALEYGMPPAAGTGIGVDRLVMFLLEKNSIREVIAFPHVRPE